MEQDERENDYRAVLNLGHTVGHALEAATHYQKYLHGEAVGIGMAQAAAISVQQGFCDQRSLERIRKPHQKGGTALEIPREVSMQNLIQGMEVDKKSAERSSLSCAQASARHAFMRSLLVRFSVRSVLE